MLVKIRKDKSIVTTESHFFTQPFQPLVKWKARRFHYQQQLLKPLSSTAIQMLQSSQAKRVLPGLRSNKKKWCFENALSINFPNKDQAPNLFSYSTQ